MKIINPATSNVTSILKGVSTLDGLCKTLRFVLPALAIIALGGSIYGRGGHSTLDIVDPSFNPQVQSSVYGPKWVNEIHALPDGKILALGGFNTYNGVPVGKLIRLNADGSLDTTFNNQTVTSINSPSGGRILIQPDGKIVINTGSLVAGGQGPKPLLRLNADGTFDPTFNFTQTTANIVMDSLGRLLTMGNYTTPQGTRHIIRLNNDGSLDSSFNFTLPANTSLHRMSIQGNKPIIITDNNNNRKIYRLNEDGATDATFTSLNGLQLTLGTVQPDKKILYAQNTNLKRLNENGDSDATFQTIDTSQAGDPSLIKFTVDGKMVFTSSSSPALYTQYLSNGAVDPSFTPYLTTTSASFTIQLGDRIVIGDGVPFMPSSGNNFVRLTPGGAVDPTFNPGGTGFQSVLPGVIQAIETYSDGKILLGGKFDVINDVPRIRLARLNADSSVDTTFQVNTTSGDRFTALRDIYLIRAQSDGKIVVSGWFDYVLGGVTKKNLVRLNPDGSIDAAFNLTHPIPDYSQVILGGQNRFAAYSDGKLMVGTSKSGTSETPGPVKLTEGGARDLSFNPTLNGESTSLYFEDVAIQPDGMIVTSGSYATSSNVFKSFVARYDTDGNQDLTFAYTEETGRLRSRLVLLPTGKILITKSAHPDAGSAKVQRLNPNGSVDNSFNAVTLSDTTARINALLVMPTGKIFVGGRFTITVDGRPGKNLLQLDADGHFEPTTYDLNDEVLCLAADSEGRVLVGGGFTIIGADGGPGATRSYIARLTDGVQFDFDGDGRADISVFRPSENKWYVLRSSDQSLRQDVFAIAGDVAVPADYDGDGKTEVAVFRPSSGDWWYLSSLDGTQIYRHWGQAGDIPRPSDYDGDGKTDYVVYRPSNGYWYRLSATGQTSAIAFGIAEDKPLVGDFDGDAKSDLAVYRPSTGDWWYAASSAGGGHRVTHWGNSTDIPAPADYDGDGKTDIAVYRPSQGLWYILNSGGGSPTVINFGIAEDKPVAGDYDGDGRADIAVFRPSSGVWYVMQSTAGVAVLQFGNATDIPTPNAFVP